MDAGELFLISIGAIAFFLKICYNEYIKGVKEAEEEERQARLQRQKEREQKEELAKIINAAITTQVSSVSASPSPIVGEIKCPQCGGTKVSEIGQGRYKCQYCGTLFSPTTTKPQKNEGTMLPPDSPTSQSVININIK